MRSWAVRVIGTEAKRRVQKSESRQRACSLEEGCALDAGEVRWLQQEAQCGAVVLLIQLYDFPVQIPALQQLLIITARMAEH